MTASVKKPATYADIEALPVHMTGEIIDGVLYTQPRPITKHNKASHRLGRVLEGTYEFDGGGGLGGWIFLVEQEVELGPHIVVPDVAGWHADRLPDNYLDLARIKVAPDWVCELLSPSTAKRDKGVKSRVYATYRVGHLWFIDPLSQTLEVFVRKDQDWTLHAFFEHGDKVSAPPFEAAPFDLGFLWPARKGG